MTSVRHSNNRLLVSDQDQWERLCNHPDALSGTWDPATQQGVVIFGTAAAALAAGRELL